MKDRIYLSSPSMTGKEMSFIDEAFATNWIAPLGPNVDMFEKEIAEYVGVGHAAALTTGTAAIHLAFKALGVSAGDLVFCSNLTFSATCNPIIYQNATPVFIDSEPDTWNMSPKALRKAFENHPKPKAVIVVHLYGTPANMDEIVKICKEHNVPLVEDAAESLGSTYKEKQTGTFSDIAIYSFNGNKIITTSGGGMLVANDEDVVKKTRFWATQSRDPAPYYQHSELGYNYRMSNILAGIGRGQLLSLDDKIEKKTYIYNYYKDAFKDITDIKMNPFDVENTQPNHWLSCITLDEKSKVTPMQIINELEKENIESRPIWKPMNMQPFFEKYEFFIHDNNQISVGEDIFNRGLCLPSDVKMTDEDLDRIVSIIKKLF